MYIGNHNITASAATFYIVEAAKEGMVLLKNEKNLLPLAEGTRIALFGKGSFDYVKGGGGSGDVMVSYVHNLYDGLKMQERRICSLLAVTRPLSLRGRFGWNLTLVHLFIVG